MPFDTQGAEVDPEDRRRKNQSRAGRMTAMLAIAMIAIAAIAINIACSVDFASDGWYAFLELVRRGIYFCVLLIGLSAAAVTASTAVARQRDENEFDFRLDNRPAPWMLYAILAALATFLIHNLIEFSLFEPGPWFLFALLTGGTLGLRSEGKRRKFSPAEPASPFRRPAATIATALAGAGWLAAAICW